MVKTLPSDRTHYVSGHHSLYILHQDLLLGSWVLLHDASVSETHKNQGLVTFPQKVNPEVSAFLESYAKPLRNTCIAAYKESSKKDTATVYNANISIFTKFTGPDSVTTVSCQFRTVQKIENAPITLPKPKSTVWDFYRNSIKNLPKILSP